MALPEYEIKFLEKLAASKNEFGQYIYVSHDGKHSVNLPYLLELFKEQILKDVEDKVFNYPSPEKTK